MFALFLCIYVISHSAIYVACVFHVNYIFLQKLCYSLLFCTLKTKYVTSNIHFQAVFVQHINMSFYNYEMPSTMFFFCAQIFCKSIIATEFLLNIFIHSFELLYY